MVVEQNWTVSMLTFPASVSVFDTTWPKAVHWVVLIAAEVLFGVQGKYCHTQLRTLQQQF